MARRSARKDAPPDVVHRASGLTKRASASGKPCGPGTSGPNSFGFRLGRGTTTTFAETLDLVPNVLRQSDPDFAGIALGPIDIQDSV
jgi:hypothetical protein